MRNPIEDAAAQSVFDAVIGAGLYGADAHEYMCHAIRDAEGEGVLSRSAASRGIEAIDKYLHELSQGVNGSLFGALGNAGLSSHRTAAGALAIYKDWANRPHKPQE